MIKAIIFVTQKRIESRKKCFENLFKEILEVFEIKRYGLLMNNPGNLK